MINVLIVDDEPAVVSLVTRALEKTSQYRIFTADTAIAARDQMIEQQIDVAVFDVLLPDDSGLNLLAAARDTDPRLPVILMTGGGTAGTAIEAMKAGAFDYITKPLNVAQLREIVARAAEVRQLMTSPVSLAHTIEDVQEQSGDLMVGRSAAMTDVYKSIGRVAPRDVTVLIRGESGTGKELVARSIYQHSARCEQPFLAVNCAAIPESLLESELFGHEKGAFTGADRRRIGKFEQCDGGTIFLDEIGDMPLSLQGKILRLIQDQRFERVGGNETIQTDVRIITATHRDLEAMSTAGRFRADLYYRLNVYEIRLPPLRERMDDLPILVGHFLRTAGKELGQDVHQLSPAAEEALQAYPWPGNIRELQSTLNRAVLNSSGPVLLEEFLPKEIRRTAAADEHSDASSAVALPTNFNWDAFVDDRLDDGCNSLYDESIERLERWLITRVLRRTNGNQLQAAARLGITRTTLRSKLARLGLSIEKVVDEGPGRS